MRRFLGRRGYVGSYFGGGGASTVRSPLLGRADHAGRFHGLDQSRCTVVADLQPALHAGNRGTGLGDHPQCFVIQRVGLVAGCTGLGQAGGTDDHAVAHRLHLIQHAVDIVGRAHR